MTSLEFALYVTGLFLWKIALATKPQLSTSVRQESGYISANVGDNVTLRCYYEADVSAMFYWYKQTLGQKPQVVSTYYRHDTDGNFAEEFKNSRFSLDPKEGKHHLNIYDLQISDSATYYCIACHAYKFEFGEGITVSVKGSGLNIPVLVHQSASETIQPGETRSCTVHTGTCDGEHSVYWFKDSDPGLIYTHGDGTDQCERKPNTQTHTCGYDLPKKNLNLFHTDSYYCAVASCGHILFGNRTKLDFEDVNFLDFLVHFLSGALVFTTILCILLAFCKYKIVKRNSCQCTESGATFSSPSTEGNQDADNLHYAALRGQRMNRARKKRDDTLSECVYSTVRM